MLKTREVANLGRSLSPTGHNSSFYTPPSASWGGSLFCVGNRMHFTAELRGTWGFVSLCAGVFLQKELPQVWLDASRKFHGGGRDVGETHSSKNGGPILLGQWEDGEGGTCVLPSRSSRDPPLTAPPLLSNGCSWTFLAFKDQQLKPIS